MKLSFHGAAQTVTGSKHLLTLNNGNQILLDCGLFQGLGKQTENLNSSFGFNAENVTAMILSHAHIDHCGLVPKLIKEGFTGNIFCTPATKDLATILLLDSAAIQTEDIKYINKKRLKIMQPPLEPLYDTDDATLAVKHFQEIEYNNWFTVINGVEAMFTDAGHIIGSAAVHLKVIEDGQTTAITFSGDVGRYQDLILKAPQIFPQANYIILESTYGNSLHDNVLNTTNVLLQWITKTITQKKGKLIIPAFSVGRTQELLYSLNQLSLEGKLPNINVYVDSPLSKKATQIVKQYPAYFNNKVQTILEEDDDPFNFKGLHFIESATDSKALNNLNQPCIIIAASGMADAGRIKHHIANNISNPNNTILLVGYCEPNSLGGRLMNGQKEVRIFSEFYQVEAEIGSMRSMSAHGDYNDLIRFISCQNAALVKTIFLVHGEPDVQFDFKNNLLKQDFKDIVVPEMHQEVQIN